MDGDALKAIGAAIGIAVSAVASTIAAIIAVLRYRWDQRHVVVRLKAYRPLEDQRDVWLKASIYNQGRPVFIEDAYLHLGREDMMDIGDEDDFPVELATGRSINVRVQLTRFEHDLMMIAEQVDDPVTYKDEDLPGMRLRVSDGEGHEHSASLRGESLRNMRLVVKARRMKPSEPP